MVELVYGERSHAQSYEEGATSFRWPEERAVVDIFGATTKMDFHHVPLNTRDGNNDVIFEESAVRFDTIDVNSEENCSKINIFGKSAMTTMPINASGLLTTVNDIEAGTENPPSATYESSDEFTVKLEHVLKCSNGKEFHLIHHTPKKKQSFQAYFLLRDLESGKDIAKLVSYINQTLLADLVGRREPTRAEISTDPIEPSKHSDDPMAEHDYPDSWDASIIGCFTVHVPNYPHSDDDGGTSWVKIGEVVPPVVMGSELPYLSPGYDCVFISAVEIDPANGKRSELCTVRYDHVHGYPVTWKLFSAWYLGEMYRPPGRNSVVNLLDDACAVVVGLLVTTLSLPFTMFAFVPALFYMCLLESDVPDGPKDAVGRSQPRWRCRTRCAIMGPTANYGGGCDINEIIGNFTITNVLDHDKRLIPMADSMKVTFPDGCTTNQALIMLTVGLQFDTIVYTSTSEASRDFAESVAQEKGRWDAVDAC